MLLETTSKLTFVLFWSKLKKNPYYQKSIQVDSEDQFFAPKNISFQLLSFSC